MRHFAREAIIKRALDRALWIALEAFVREGFVLKPIDGAELLQPTTSQKRRQMLLKATYPDVIARRLRLDRDIAVLIAFDELGDCETRMTITIVTSWQGAHPSLAALADALDGHVERVLSVLSHRELSTAAAA